MDFCTKQILYKVCSLLNKNNQVEKTITGKVVFDNIAVSDVHIVNKNTNIGTITNKNGVFDISASLGDTLHFTHINLEEKLVAITKKIIISVLITLVSFASFANEEVNQAYIEGTNNFGLKVFQDLIEAKSDSQENILWNTCSIRGSNSCVLSLYL